MLCIGIDWSQNHHNVSFRNAAGCLVSHFQIEHSVEGFARFDAERRKFNVLASDCYLAIETAYSSLTDYALDRNYVVYIVPPKATEAYRNRERQSGAHDDDTDADLLSGIMVTDRDTHRRLHPNLPLTQHMLGEMRLIETLRRSIQRQTNQLQAALYRTYPQAVGLFSDLTCQITLEFLIAYPTAPEAQGLSAEAFETFLRQHGYTRLSLIPIRYAHLLEPMPAANPAVIHAHRDLVRTLAHVLLPQVKCRMQAIENLHRLFSSHPDAFIFQSLPVQGELLPPSLLVKFGDHRDRFPCAGDIQALAGTCPATVKSGQRRRVYFRQACDKEFRRIIQQFARLSIGRSGWAQAYYHDIRPHCHSDSHAIRILANRWLAILWKLWSTRQTYDEAYHLQQRARRRRPLA